MNEDNKEILRYQKRMIMNENDDKEIFKKK